jgi:hypothetical protein
MSYTRRTVPFSPVWATKIRKRVKAQKKLRQNVTSKEAADSNCRETTPAVLQSVQINNIQKKPDTGPGRKTAILRRLQKREIVSE